MCVAVSALMRDGGTALASAQARYIIINRATHGHSAQLAYIACYNGHQRCVIDPVPVVVEAACFCGDLITTPSGARIQMLAFGVPVVSASGVGIAQCWLVLRCVEAL